MPDLSENLINESQTWEEIQEIKAMPVPMAQKRELKNQLQVCAYKFYLCRFTMGKSPKNAEQTAEINEVHSIINHWRKFS
jgi:hypothetical protein